MALGRNSGIPNSSITPRVWGRGERDAMHWPTLWSMACWLV